MGTLGTLFKEKRESLGLTQKEVANKAGIALYQHISNLERGTRISPSFALKLGKILGLHKDEVYKAYLKDKQEDIKKAFGV